MQSNTDIISNHLAQSPNPGMDPVETAAARVLSRSEEQLQTGAAEKPTNLDADASPSRSALQSSASWWRSLQCIGMNLHFLAPPRPPNPKFVRSIPATISDKAGTIDLHFYLPDGYESQDDPSTTWPVVVNFHGGGFTLGKPTDDARFARFVLEKAGAVFVSVGYRLAPEYPFPTAVDDGADALLYLVNHASDLRLDPTRIVTSGFSAGGNLAITVLLRIEELREAMEIPDHRVVAVATWYPITDYTLSREERRATSRRPDQTLPPSLTNLFDASYLFPPNLELDDPCLSPSKASDMELSKALPSNILFYTCEWDMLLQEGEALARRLGAPPISKVMHYTMIRKVTHGWDKGPNPLKAPQKSERMYAECCRRLNKILREDESKSKILGIWKSSSSSSRGIATRKDNQQLRPDMSISAQA